MQLGKEEDADDSLPPPGEVINAVVLNWTVKYILFRYTRHDKDFYGVFRANGIYVNGIKAKKWETNDLELFFQSNGSNASVSNFIPYNSALGKADLAFKLNGVDEVIRPKICACNAWIGNKFPPEEDLLFGRKKASEYKAREKQIGVVVSFDRVSNVGWIQFRNEGGRKGMVKFRISTLSLQGESPSKETGVQYVLDLLSKPESERLLHFDCVFDSAKHSISPCLDEEMEQWVACSVWPAHEERPSSRDRDPPLVCEGKKDNARLKQTFPMPWEATSEGVESIILSSDGVIGRSSLLKDPSKTVLFTRSRCYVEGRLVKFVKDVNYFRPGVSVQMDIVEADPNESQGVYDYVAVLVWIGQKPGEEDVVKEMENPTSYRAKVIKLAPPILGVGITSGVLHILNGSAFANERVLFSRDVVYIFSFSMVKGDLAYVLKEFDKVNVEFKLTSQEEREESLRMYGCIVKYKASCVWIGYFPRAVVESYNYKNLTPFLTKRNLSLQMFQDIVGGVTEPKLREQPPIDSLVLPPNNLIGRLIEIKKPDFGSTDGTQRGVMVIENGPHAKKKAFFNRNSLFIFGRNMHKADLMRVVKESDKFFIDVQGDTHSSQVPFKVTKAWIGLHPDEYKRLKQVLSSYFANKFINWLSSHGMTEAEFEEIAAGKATLKPFFPFASEQMNARIIYFYPSCRKVGESSSEKGAEFGLLRITQGPLIKRDVLFERSDFYLFNVSLRNVDLTQLLKEGEKVFCEVSEIIGKDRKIWQTRLGVSGVPRYCANLIWILGARPKANKLNINYEKNDTLIKWLRKRNYDMESFVKLVKSEPKNPSLSSSDVHRSVEEESGKQDQQLGPIEDQAHRLITKLLRTSLSDPYQGLSSVISSETELNLAIFLNDRLKKAIACKCVDGSSNPPGNPEVRPLTPPPPPVISRESYDNTLGWANKDQSSLFFESSSRRSNGDDDGDAQTRVLQSNFPYLSLCSSGQHSNNNNNDDIKPVYSKESLSDSYFSFNINSEDPLSTSEIIFDVFKDKMQEQEAPIYGLYNGSSAYSHSNLLRTPSSENDDSISRLHSETHNALLLKDDALIKRKFTPGEH